MVPEEESTTFDMTIVLMNGVIFQSLLILNPIQKVKIITVQISWYMTHRFNPTLGTMNLK